MRQPDVFHGQVGLVEDLVREHAAQSDLGGADQAQVGVFDRINLRFITARREPDPLQDIITGQVGRDDGSEPGVDQFSQRELLQCQIEQNGVVLEEIESGPADLAGRLEIDQIQALAQLDVVFDLEIEHAWRADLAQLVARILGQTDRRIRMGHIGDPPQRLRHLGLETAQLIFFLGHRGLQALALVDERGPLFWIALAARCLRHLVLTAAGDFDFTEYRATLELERDHTIDVEQNIGRRVAITAILLHDLGIGDDEFQIEHENTLLKATVPKTSRASISDGGAEGRWSNSSRPNLLHPQSHSIPRAARSRNHACTTVRMDW